MDTAKQRAKKEKAMFSLCKDREHLQNWLKIYLNIDLPNSIVDESSNSSPLDLVWEIYNKARHGDDEAFSQVLSYASRDSFKCQSKGTKILSKNKGLVNIEDVDISDIIWSGKSWQKVNNWIHDGIKDSVKITLKNGIECTGTPIHRYWAWEPGGKPNWKKGSELTSKDLVCVDTSHNYGNTSINNEEWDIGYICGLLQGDGCLTMMNKKYSYRITLSTNDTTIKNFWFDFCYKNSGKYPKQSKSRKYDYIIHSKEITNKFESFGLKNCYSFEKEVPEICLKNNSYMAGFVSGILDTDGTITRKKTIELAVTAEKLVRQLGVVLHALGVNCSIYSNKRIYKNQNHIIHKIIINQNDIASLINAGVRLSAKKAVDIHSVLISGCVNTHDSIPMDQIEPLLKLLPTNGGKQFRFNNKLKPKVSKKYPSLSRQKLINLVDWAEERNALNKEQILYWRNILQNKWVSIKKVEYGNADFYDLTVENDHSYWSNGLISHNTVSTAVLETLFILHFHRDVVHLAAIQQQSEKAQGYIKAYFALPILRDYVTKRNERRVEITKYKDSNGKFISPVTYGTLSVSDKQDYNPVVNYIQVIVSTMQSTNGEHAQLLVMDELEIMPKPQIIEEARLVPTVGMDGSLPITLLTSSRKFSYGFVQKEIDNAKKTGTHIRHWNILDVTQKCPPTRHLPQEPKIPIYVNEMDLEAISEDSYKDLDPEAKQNFDKIEGFEGCLTRCSLFSVCKGRLATVQQSDSKMLKPIPLVIAKFKEVSTEVAKAQLICRKPSTEGLIYPKFDKNIHVLNARKMAEKMTGLDSDVFKNFGKKELLQMMKSKQMEFYSGVDFGFTHNFAVVTGAVWNNSLYIIDVISMQHLESTEKVEILNSRIRDLNPTLFPDPEDPSEIKTFRKHGYTCRDFEKDVLGGINAVRAKIKPNLGVPAQLYILDHPLHEVLIKELSQYHWKLDSAGNLTNQPDKVDDDSPDALRYLVQNLFQPQGQLFVAGSPDGDPSFQVPENQYTTENWMRKIIQEKASGTESNEQGDDNVKVKRGGFIVDF